MRLFSTTRGIAFFAMAAVTLWASAGIAATIHVPGDQPTIQAGIDAASDGDMVLVASGTYVETNDFLGKAIIVQSETGADVTVIDGNQAGSVVTFDSGETEWATLDGFTIRNGTGTYFELDPGSWNYVGGGIFCLNSSPTITNCTISGNRASYACGGISCDSSSPTITNCTISGNTADYSGGIGCRDSFPIITNCTISDNNADIGAGGIYCGQSNPTITHCTMSGNSAGTFGGAIACENSDPMITNCILWGDSALYGPEIYVTSGSPAVTYSDVQGGWSGKGNIDADPLFVGGGDFHLTVNSPCIDSGTDAGVYTDMDGEVRPLGAGIDMGADEHTDPDCRDGDLDGYGDMACGGHDCDDSDPGINPGAAEHCDAIDWDCTGDPIDLDADADGHIDDDPICMGDDCDDEDSMVYPGAEELCDGKDNDCDGTDPVDEMDDDGDGWRICAGDCDDAEPLANPGTDEIIDGIDNDCDGEIDELFTILLVPSEYPTVQDGIDWAHTGDIVLVAPGTYVERINFLGKAITVQSASGADVTTIDGDQAGSVVTFNSGETEDSILNGFSILGGIGTYLVADDLYVGGGVLCSFSQPTIENCSLLGNSADAGGGIHCYYSNPMILNCTISGSSADSGGGILFVASSPWITNCTISGNSAELGGGISYDNSSSTITDCSISGNDANQGGGIFLSISSLTIANLTIAENSATSLGGGIYCWDSSLSITNCTISENINRGIYCKDSFPTIVNCIFWGDSGGEISGSPVVTYSDVQGGWSGEGNIDADPLFVGGGDFHLTLNSPCIDSGTGAGVYTDMDGEVRPLGAGFDIGADEYTDPDCRDGDMDGYGDMACGGDDCDDSDPAICPGADDPCDGIDQACDGLGEEVDSDIDSYMICEGDCDDTDSDTYPGAPDPCDGMDQGCDGEDGLPEICDNGIDDDCDGLIDYPDDPDCVFIELVSSYDTGLLSLDFTLRTVEEALWANYLILTYPTFQVIHLWTVPLPVIDPPSEFPISFPFPKGLQWIGIWTGLFTVVGAQAVDLEWVHTGIDVQSNLPDTGIEFCYDGNAGIPSPYPGEPFYGQDAQYVTNPMSFTDHGDGTVTDNITGLMWQQEDDDVPRTWQGAINYCNGLTLAGHTDWRPPDEYELQSIVDYGRIDPVIDTTYFPGTISSYYWSSSTYPSIMGNAYRVSFFDGHVGYNPKSHLKNARCVRGESTEQSFTDHGDGMVTDNVTGLMWQQEDDDVGRDWEDALAYCEELELAGYADWRLPDIKELRTIVDNTTYNPAIDTTYFPGTISFYYWSSSTNAYDTSTAWRVYFYDGYTLRSSKYINLYARCVR